MGAFRTSCASLDWSLPGDKPAFAGLSPHQKFPFPAQGGDWFDDCVVGPQFEPNYLHQAFQALSSLTDARSTRVLQVILQFWSLFELQHRCVSELNVAAKVVGIEGRLDILEAVPR
jgi:hypothetical protein